MEKGKKGSGRNSDSVTSCYVGEHPMRKLKKQKNKTGLGDGDIQSMSWPRASTNMDTTDSGAPGEYILYGIGSKSRYLSSV